MSVRRARKDRSLITGWDLTASFIKLDTSYAALSRFFLSDRRTGHRWQVEGPSNPVARLIQLMLALGLTLEDTKLLIDAGVAKAGSGVLPAPVVDLSSWLAVLSSEQEARMKDTPNDKRDRSEAGADSSRSTTPAG